jgi:ParB/RepB/Spo0J family partition protein
LDHLSERYNVREQYRAMDDLRHSMAVHDLITPIVVRPNPTTPEDADGPHYWIVSGHRRTRAARDLGWADIPATVKDLDDVGSLQLGIVENTQRSSLSPMEVARGIKRLIDAGEGNQSEIARKLGMSPSDVSVHLKLLTLPEEVQEKLDVADDERQPRLSVSHAEELFKIDDPDPEQRIAKQRAFADKALKYDLSSSTLSTWIEQAKQPDAAPDDAPLVVEVRRHRAWHPEAPVVYEPMPKPFRRRLLLYMCLQRFNDVEYFHVHGVHLRTPWAFVSSLSEREVEDALADLAVRFITAGHRYPILDRTLMFFLDAYRTHEAPDPMLMEFAHGTVQAELDPPKRKRGRKKAAQEANPFGDEDPFAQDPQFLEFDD